MQSLLDLAELNTSGEVAGALGDAEELDEETVELRQWLQSIEPVKR